MRRTFILAVALLALSGVACSSKNKPSGSQTTPGSTFSTGTGPGTATATGPTASGGSAQPTPCDTSSPKSGNALVQPGQHVVGATDSLAFSPSKITINRCDRIEWLNNGSANHTVTFYDKSFDQPLPPKKSVSRQFLVAGTFKYHCTIHANMTAQVTVTG